MADRLVAQSAHAVAVAHDDAAPRHGGLVDRRQGADAPADHRAALGGEADLEAGAVHQVHDRQMEGLRHVDEADDLVARIRGPRAAVEQRVAGHQRHRPAVQPAEAGDDRAAEHTRHLEEAALVHQRLDDPAHVVGLLLHARDRGDQELLAPLRIVPVAHARGHVPDRAGQIRQEAARGVERLLLGVHRVIDRAAGDLHVPAAELLLGARLAQPLHHRRAGDEHRRDLLHHHRVMAGGQPRGAEAGDRAQAQRHHRHRPHVVGHQVERGGLRQPAGQVGAAGGLDRLHRTAAAGALDQPDDRHAELRRDLLRHLRLALDRGIRRTAAQGEVVAGDHHRAAIDGAAPEHAVGGSEGGDLLAVSVVGRLAGDRADLVEAAGIQHAVDPLADGEAAALVLARDAVRPAQLLRQRDARAEFGEFRLPADRCGLLRAWRWRRRRASSVCPASGVSWSAGRSGARPASARPTNRTERHRCANAPYPR